jgi:hypothetical protein
MENSGLKKSKEDQEYPVACYVVGIFLIVYLIISVCVILIVYLKYRNILVDSYLLRSHVICGAFGMLGAAIASIRKYYQYLITYSTARAIGRSVQPMDWSLGWIYYYLTRPILGAALGALTYLLSFIGFHVLIDSPSLDISYKGKYFLYAVAFVSGFSVSHVLDRVDAVAKQIFQAGQKSI